MENAAVRARLACDDILAFARAWIQSGGLPVSEEADFARRLALRDVALRDLGAAYLRAHDEKVQGSAQKADEVALGTALEASAPVEDASAPLLSVAVPVESASLPEVQAPVEDASPPEVLAPVEDASPLEVNAPVEDASLPLPETPERTESTSTLAAKESAAPDLAALRQHFGNGNAVRFKETHSVSVLPAIGLPPLQPDADDCRDELCMLESGLYTLETVSKHQQQHTDLLRILAARTRHIQQTCPAELENKVADIFRRMSSLSRNRNFGYVVGMQTDHSPPDGSWYRFAIQLMMDAGYISKPPTSCNAKKIQEVKSLLAQGPTDKKLEECIQAAIAEGLSPSDTGLVRLLARSAPQLQNQQRLPKALRSAIKQELRQDDKVEEHNDKGTGVSPDVLRQTKGKHVILVGGDERKEAKKRIRAAFQLRFLEWETGLNPRRIDATAQRIRQGSADLVILLVRFLGHKTTERLVPELRRAGIPFAVVHHGYGVAALANALAPQRVNPATSLLVSSLAAK